MSSNDETDAGEGRPSPAVDRGDRLARLTGRLNALQAELIEEIAEVIDTGEWSDGAFRSVSHWLTIQMGVTPGHARQLEATARRIGEFPLTADKFRQGLLSHDQFNAAVSEAPAWADVHTYELIEYATTTQIRRIIRAQFPPPTNDAPCGDDVASDDAAGDDATGDQAGGAGTPASGGQATMAPNADHHFRDRFSFGWNTDGRFTGSFDLAAPAGMILDQALNEARDQLFRSQHRDNATSHAGHTNSEAGHTERPLPVPDIGWADALVELAHRSLANAPSGRVERFKHYLHLDVEAWSTNVPGLAVTLGSGVRLPQAVAEYVTCDMDVQPIWERDNTPIGAGHATRTISNRLRRLIERRDQGCRVPGCAGAIVQIHHIQHWSSGGVTETWNLISLCGAHHRMHHAGRLGITGNPDLGTIRFTDRHGRPLQTGPKPIPPPTAPSSTRSSCDRGGAAETLPTYRRPSGERLQLQWFSRWESPDSYQPLAAPIARAWREHQRRRRPLAQA